MTTLNFLQRFSFCFLTGVSICALQACDDDDENGSSLPQNNVGEIVPESGEKLLTAGMYNFYYTQDGQLEYITDWDETYKFSSGQVVAYYDGEEDEVTNLSYNGKGYISKTSTSEVWEDEYSKGSYTSTANLTYDGEGHLVKITGKYTGKYTYEGETETEEGSSTANFTWNDGLLTKYEFVESDNDGWSYKETVTFDYDGKRYINKYQQYATFIDVMYGGFAGACAYIGLFGTGPDYLPASVEIVETEMYDGEEEYSYDFSETYTYEFDDKGRISCVNDYDDFTYGTYEDQGHISDEYQACVTRAGQKAPKKAFGFGARFKARIKTMRN